MSKVDALKEKVAGLESRIAQAESELESARCRIRELEAAAAGHQQKRNSRNVEADKSGFLLSFPQVCRRCADCSGFGFEWTERRL
jgi:chromosome segregation ATPase